jgi:nucleotide sugar dehydrogenase
MNITVIGVGRLGLCMSLCFASKNNKIIGIDINEDYINSLKNNTFISAEKDVNIMLDKYKDNIIFTTDISQAFNSDIIFIVVPTPTLANDEYDHSIIDNIINQLITYGYQEKKINLVISSTTMPGYCNTVYDKLEKLNYDICYNPEFIAQGTIIIDMLNPDIILIGESNNLKVNTTCCDKIINIYSAVVNNKPKIQCMSLIEAEIVKISINCFITTKIAFANMIGDSLIAAGYNADKALKAIGSDKRIGSQNLRWGFGYGGPCFPRDNRALSKFLSNNNIYNNICKATDESNKLHLDQQIKQFEINHPNKNEIIQIRDITYKKDTEILEESQQLQFAIKLSQAGYKVQIIDNPNIINKIHEIYDGFLYIHKTI